MQNADCRPLFSGLESNGTILFSPSFAWWRQWSAAVCGLHFVRTVLATKIPRSNFGPHWLSPLHCHGRCESIVFSCSFQTGILLNLLSAVHISTMLPFFRPKGVADETLGKVKQGTVECPPSTFIAALNTWPISALKNTYQLRVLRWTPRYGPYLTHAHNHITIVVAALIGANLHVIAIGIMNVKSRVGVTRASGLKWVLSETCSEEYMTKKAVKMRDLTHVSYSLLSSGS